jgi:ABC-type bacteriocin/lantibiotic exporter with double-glycine peptidase domain
MSSAHGAASDIITLLDSTPEIDAESTEGRTPEDVRGHIRLEDIHFRYPTRPGVRVLRSLNIEVKPGTYIALVGASGCGKSTVYVLMSGIVCLVVADCLFAVFSSLNVSMTPWLERYMYAFPFSFGL